MVPSTEYQVPTRMGPLAQRRLMSQNLLGLIFSHRIFLLRAIRTAYFAAAYFRLRCTTFLTYSLYACLFLPAAPPEDEILACTPATLWAAITEGHPDEARGFIPPTNGMICCCICSASLHNMSYVFSPCLFISANSAT